MDLDSYDKIVIYFSGGKDSLACLLNLLELGVDRSKIELWHHEIDGREGSNLMDWSITPDYCRKVAAAFGLPIYFSWKVGGFERELWRRETLTAPTRFETPDGEVCQIGGTRGKPNTRRKFPMPVADLKKRYCSPYLKIDVGAAALRNQERFSKSRTLTISGERAEESPERANYLEFEPDRADNRGKWVTQLTPYQHLPGLVYKPSRSERHVDRWRPVHKWTEPEVWATIEKYKVNPHPAYQLGWGRVSCQFCIFGSPNQCASSQVVSPERFEKISVIERITDCTIKTPKAIKRKGKIIGYHPKETVKDYAAKGNPYEMDPRMIEIANSVTYNEQVILDDWQLPPGAFGESCGPT